MLQGKVLFSLSISLFSDFLFPLITKLTNRILTDKLTSLQKELREEKRERTDAQSEKESLELKYADLTEAMEMMTLDKEMAEERAENLQQEVNLLKEKIEEISVDLDVFKKEGGG